ncbi:MAG: DUF423 domain-containing protein [Pseudomonadota bacterium]
MALRDGQIWLPIGALYGLLAVTAAAFIAHRTPVGMTPGAEYLFELAVIFHLSHALALIVLSLAWSHISPAMRPLARLAGLGFSLGVPLFSGSLYWLSLNGPGSLGPLAFLTPAGGTGLLIGWLALSLLAWRI